MQKGFARRGIDAAPVQQRFGLLLSLLLAAFVASGFSEFRWARVLATVLQFLMLGVAFVITHQKGRFPVMICVFALSAGVTSITAFVHESQRVVHGVAATGSAILYLVLLVLVFKQVLAQDRVETETLLGALCVYFLIGMMFTGVYSAIDAFSTQPVFGHPTPRSDYSYFSFVTLTTVGYGDVVATSDIARRFAVVEAMTGQLFLATAVARLVSLYGAEARERRQSELSATAGDHVAPAVDGRDGEI